MRYTNTTRKSGMTPNGPKVREAIVHVIREADRRGVRVTQFEVLKVLFLADKAHLNRYGRPITFDDYAAMKDGPVASLAYNVLKEERAALDEAEIAEALWRVKWAGIKKKHYYEASREASEDVLSESDFEALNEALTTVKKLGYDKTWDLVHADPAYKAAWAERGDSKSVPMNYALLFDEPDNELAEELKFLAAHA